MAQKYNFRLTTLLTAACPWEKDFNYIHKETAKIRAYCNEKIDSVMNYAKSISPDIIIYSEPTYVESSHQQYTNLIKTLQKITTKIIVIQANYYQSSLDLISCLNKYPHNIQQCTLNHKDGTIYQPKKNIKKLDQIVIKNNEILNKLKVQIIDLTDLFSFNQLFPPIVNDILVYRHVGYITHSYTMYIEPVLTFRFLKVLQSLQYISQAIPKQQDQLDNKSNEIKHIVSLDGFIPSKELALFKTELKSYIKQSLKDIKIPQKYKILPDDLYTRNLYAINCIDNNKKTTFDSKHSCILGSNSNKDINTVHTIAVVGNTYAHQWLPALDQISDYFNYKIITVIVDKCPWETESFHYLNKQQEEELYYCQEKIKSATNFLKENKPWAIIYSETAYINNNKLAFRKLLDKFKAITSRVIWLQANYHQSTLDILSCLSKYQANTSKCMLDHNNGNIYQKLSNIKKYDDMIERQKEMAKKREIYIIDVTDYFHFNQYYPVIIKGMLVYNQPNHISRNYVIYLAPVLKEYLQHFMYYTQNK